MIDFFKKFKFFLNFIFVFCFFFIFSSSANALTVLIKGYQKQYGSTPTLIKSAYGDDGKAYIAYCADSNKPFPSVGSIYENCRDYDRNNSTLIKKVFENGPNRGKLPYDNTSKNYQLNYQNYQEQIWNLAAKNAPDIEGGYEEISFSGNNKLKFDTNSFKYYISSSIKIKAPNSNIKISVKGVDGAFIVKNKYDEFDKKIDTVTSNSTFFVKVPFESIVDENTKISLYAETVSPIDASKLYICGNPDSKYQEIVIYDHRDGTKIVNGSFSLKPVISYKKCDPFFSKDKQSNCNGSFKLESNCNHLTVINKSEKVLKDVTISQNGYITTFLNTNKIYNGGGFSIGIMFSNNVKWNYLNKVESGAKHKSIVSEMNKKIKSLEEYSNSISLSNFKIDNVIYNDMQKMCWSSSDNLDYYGEHGLTHTCIFYFPKYILNYDGSAEIDLKKYNNINNKYYVSFNKNGNIPIEFDVNGLNRFKDNVILNDSFTSPSKGIRWTDNDKNDLWNNSYLCSIDIYNLFFNSQGKYNFIYRPIDLSNPFPNRNAGLNWYQWYMEPINQARLVNSYEKSKLDYIVKINNNSLNSLKKYKNNYIDWSSINNGKSSIISENSDVFERVGD